MNPKIEDREFRLLSDDELPAVIGPAVLSRCRIDSCIFGYAATSPAERRKIVGVELHRCWSSASSSIGTATIEDVVVCDHRSSGLTHIIGAALRHVVVRGKCGSFLFRPWLDDDSEIDAVFAAANDEFYRSVDWALDISDAECTEMDIRTIPADLIRRDPETQAIVRLNVVQETREQWQRMNVHGAPWQSVMHRMIRSGEPDAVLVAPKRSKNFKAWLAGIEVLRKAGIAEPD